MPHQLDCLERSRGLSHLPTCAQTHTPCTHPVHAHSPFSWRTLPVLLEFWFYNGETQLLPLQFLKIKVKRRVEGHLQGMVGTRGVPFSSLPGAAQSPPSSGLRVRWATGCLHQPGGGEGGSADLAGGEEEKHLLWCQGSPNPSWQLPSLLVGGVLCSGAHCLGSVLGVSSRWRLGCISAPPPRLLCPRGPASELSPSTLPPPPPSHVPADVALGALQPREGHDALLCQAWSAGSAVAPQRIQGHPFPTFLIRTCAAVALFVALFQKKTHP